MHIKELILQTESIKKTRLFYHKTMELEILSETDETISFKAGKTKLTFQEVKGMKPFYHFAFNITNNKFADSYEWMDQKVDLLIMHNGTPIMPYENWNARSFYFYDNNGSILEFIVRDDLSYHSDKDISSDCIEEISEIGLVTDDVENLCTELHDKYRIPFFKRGPKLADFAAMGDDYGLLLVCRNKRGWVPTNKPAHIFPVTVIDDTGNEIRVVS